MKKILVLLAVLFIASNSVFAEYAIPELKDGMILKCVAKMDTGSYTEYQNGNTDYYEYKKGKIYSSNMSKMFGNPNYKKKVLRLKITDDAIYFKDRLYRWGKFHYKWVKIYRDTGRYSFYAKKQYFFIPYYRQACCHGTCTVEE